MLESSCARVLVTTDFLSESLELKGERGVPEHQLGLANNSLMALKLSSWQLCVSEAFPPENLAEQCTNCSGFNEVWNHTERALNQTSWPKKTSQSFGEMWGHKHRCEVISTLLTIAFICLVSVRFENASLRWICSAEGVSPFLFQHKRTGQSKSCCNFEE